MGKLFLVTGEKGFIGRNLISYMDEQDIQYTLSDWKNTDTIIHLSAFTNVREAILNPQPREYWIEKFELQGAKYCKEESESLQDIFKTINCSGWFKDSLKVFRK